MAVSIIRWKQASLTQATSEFTDIDSHWAESFIQTAASLKLMNGYLDHTFRPNQSLTRAEAVTIVNRLLGRRPLTEATTPAWLEVPPDYWAYRDIQEASTNYWLTKQDDGTEKSVTDTILN